MSNYLTSEFLSAHKPSFVNKYQYLIIRNGGYAYYCLDDLCTESNKESNKFSNNNYSVLYIKSSDFNNEDEDEENKKYLKDVILSNTITDYENQIINMIQKTTSGDSYVLFKFNNSNYIVEPIDMIIDLSTSNNKYIACGINVYELSNDIQFIHISSDNQ